MSQRAALRAGLERGRRIAGFNDRGWGEEMSAEKTDVHVDYSAMQCPARMPTAVIWLHSSATSSTSPWPLEPLKEVLTAASVILVAGILHMGAWLRWSVALVPGKEAQEAVLGTVLAIIPSRNVIFILMLVSTYLPVALLLTKRAQAVLQDSPFQQSVSAPEEWLKDHGLFLSLQDHLSQFGLMLTPLLASPLSSLLLAPLTPTG